MRRDCRHFTRFENKLVYALFPTRILTFQQVLIVQPSQRSQFLVGVDYDLMAGPARSVHRRQYRSVADMVLLLLLWLRMVMVVGGMMIAEMTGTGAATARRDDHVVVVDEVVLRTAHLHLFRGEQDNVADAVHAVRCGCFQRGENKKVVWLD